MVFSSIVDSLKCAKLKLVAGGSSQDKPFQCGIKVGGKKCGAAFARPEYLTRHQHDTIEHKDYKAKRE